MALCDITIGDKRIPHLVKHEISEDEDSGVTETYDGDIPEEGSITRKFSLSGIIVTGDNGMLTEEELYNLTANVAGGLPIVCIDHQIKTKYSYTGAMRKSWKNSRDGKKRPTRDLEFEATSLKVEKI